MKRSDQTSAAWVEAEVDRVLSSYDDDAVGRAMPVLVMMLADAYGAEKLDSDMQDILQRVGHRIGLREGMEEAEARHLTAAFVESLDVDPSLLAALKSVFEAHAAAREAAANRKRRKLDLGFARALPAAVTDATREGTPSSRFTAQTRGMILVR